MKDLPKDVDDYISMFPEDVQHILQSVRNTILKVAPLAEESINYGMPAYKLNNKPLVYFGGFKNHIGFYATPTGHSAFAEKLSDFKHGKGSVQFPINAPMPLDLIAEITIFRRQEMTK